MRRRKSWTEPGHFRNRNPWSRGPSPELLDDYTNSMMLAFFEVHINDNQDYQPYLQSSYAIYLSKGEDFQTDLITKASAESLDQAIEKFTNERNIERIK